MVPVIPRTASSDSRRSAAEVQGVVLSSPANIYWDLEHHRKRPSGGALKTRDASIGLQAPTATVQGSRPHYHPPTRVSSAGDVTRKADQGIRVEGPDGEAP